MQSMTRETGTKAISFIVALGMFILAASMNYCASVFPLERSGNAALHESMIASICVGSGIILLLVIVTLAENHFWKGARYGFYHWKMKCGIQRALIDAGYCIRKNDKIIVLPRVKISYTNDLSAGEVIIQNALVIDRKLDDTDISPALGSYVVNKAYLSSDQNYYIYEIVDSSIPLKRCFQSVEEFADHAETVPDYQLFVDARTVIPLQSMLVVGQTGSGKTYAVYSFVLQALISRCNYHLFVADPKASSMAAVGNVITKHTATGIEAIIGELRDFVSALEERKHQMAALLTDKLDADYAYFHLEPYVFVFDEFASFMGFVQKMDKKTRDEVNELIGRVILQGRQLGFFFWIIMQKSDSAIISTAFRDNLPFKVVLGNAEDTTYTTTFGAGTEIPRRNFGKGEGVFTEPSLTEKPTPCGFPTLDFDIFEAMRRLGQVGVM